MATSINTVILPIIIPQQNAGVKAAEINKCKNYIANFDSKQATVAEMMEYSSCINMIYPPSISLDGDILIALRILLVVAIIGAIYGFMKGSDVVERLMLSLLGLFLLPAIISIIAAVLLLIGFLFF